VRPGPLPVATMIHSHRTRFALRFRRPSVACLLLVTLQPPLPPEVTPVPPLPPAPTAEAMRLPAAGAPRRLTLSEAVALALREHPEIRRAQAQLRQLVGSARAQRAALLPSVGLSYTYQSDPLAGFSTAAGTLRRPEAAIAGPPPGAAPPFDFDLNQFLARHQVSVSVNQLLFDFGGARARSEQALRRVEAARAGLEAAAETVALRVRDRYYALLQAEAMVEVQRANLAARRASLALVEARFQEGAAPYGDVARATASVGQAQAALAEALGAAEQARIALAEAIGLDPRTPVAPVPASEPEPPLPPLERLVEVALARRAERRQSQLTLAAESAGLRAARRGRWPTLFGSVVYSLRGRDFPETARGPGVILSLTWSPFDSGVTRGEIEQAQGRLAAAESELRRTELAIAGEVANAYQQVQVAEARLANARVAVASARESLRIARERYEAGIAVFVEVTDAESALAAAEGERVTAEHALHRARVALAAALGPTPRER